MSERKVLNKYYPADFDPAALTRKRKKKGDAPRIQVSRIMLPISIACARCNEFIYKGKKFNARKEEVAGESYLGVKVYRFLFKCPTCSNEISLKTDPKNADYTVEVGATRNYDEWRKQTQDAEAADEQRITEEREDAMAALENRAVEAQREMDIADALEDIRELNAKASNVDVDALRARLAASRNAQIDAIEVADDDAEDDEEAERIFGQRNSEGVLIRKDSKGLKDVESDEEKLDITDEPTLSADSDATVTAAATSTNGIAHSTGAPAVAAHTPQPTALKGIKVVKKQKQVQPALPVIASTSTLSTVTSALPASTALQNKVAAKSPAQTATASITSLVCGYASSSSDDDGGER